MSQVVGKEPCPSCRGRGQDRSGDNLIRYADGGGICFACDYVEYSRVWKNGKVNRNDDKEETLMEKTSDKVISSAENKELKSKTGFCSYRGVRSSVWKSLGCRFAFDQESGKPIRQYYPTTMDGKLSGYKRRDLPKEFGTSLGETGAVCDFYGAFLRKPNQRTLVIVGGEVDQASVYQTLIDSAKSRGYDHPNFLVVSPTVGESCVRQVKSNHKWLKSFDEVKIGLDNDDAGKKATKKVLAAMPRMKVSLIEWTRKDPNEMLEAGEENDIISCIYNSKLVTSTSIAGSSTLVDALEEEIDKERLPLPGFMKELSKLFCGGIPLGSIINIGAMSGIGKTSVVNELIYYWLFNSPYPIGILSMELSKGQYAEVLLSRHIGRKIALISDKEDKKAFIHQPETVAQAKELFTNNGKDRFYLMDERDGSIEDVMELVEEMVITCGCKVIVLDPLQDVLDGLSNEQQAIFLKWQKGMLSKYDCIFINICHLRKNDTKVTEEHTGMDILYGITEQDFQGSSSIFKSGAANVLFARNKRASCATERNSTYVMLDKCRWSGYTGFAGIWFYDNNTHTMRARELEANDGDS